MGKVGRNARGMRLGLRCKIQIAGSWSNWEPQPCKLNKDGLWEIELELAPGIYEYKYLFNNVWVLDQSKPYARNLFGSENNILTVCSKPQEVILVWDIKLKNSWSQELIHQVDMKDSEMMIALPKLCPGSYEFQLLINGCPFCDESLPHRQTWPLGLPVNTVQVWPGCSPKVKVAHPIFLPWEVKVKGDWSQEPTHCHVSDKGVVTFPLPSLPQGEHKFHFLINGSRFTDCSRPADMVKQDYLLSNNVLKVDRQTGSILI